MRQTKKVHCVKQTIVAFVKINKRFVISNFVNTFTLHLFNVDARAKYKVSSKMKLQQMYDYDCKTASAIKQKKLFGRNTNKVKNVLVGFGFLLICFGFYYVGKNSVDHKMTK